MTAEACLERWRNLRDQFVRELRRKKRVKSGDQGPQWRPGSTVETRVHSGDQGPQWRPGSTVETRVHSGDQGPQWRPGSTVHF